MSSNEPINQTLFILKANNASLSHAQNFLKNRDWTIESCLDIKDALATIFKIKPSFIMLPIDQTVKKAKLLPRLFQTAYPSANIILYFERASVVSEAIARELGSDHVVYPPASGPAVERMLLRIVREKQEAVEKHHRRERIGEAGDGASENQRIRIGGKSDQDDKVLIENRRAAEAEKMKVLQSMLSSEFGVQLPLDKILPINEIQSAQDSPEFLATTASDAPSFGNFSYPAVSYGKPKEKEERAKKNDENPGRESGEKKESASLGTASNPTDKENQAHSVRTDPKSDPPNGSVKTTAANEGALSAAELERLQKKDKDLVAQATDYALKTTEATQDKSSNKDVHNNTSKARDSRQQPITETPASLTGGQQSAKGAPQESLISADRVGCMEVKMGTLSGFLVVAYGEGRVVDSSLNEEIKKQFGEYLKSQGEKVSDISLTQIKLKPIAFESWSLAQAEFLKKSIHHAKDVAIAFFPGAVKDLVMEYADEKSMVKIDVDDIDETLPVDFNLYLHMPVNKKYLLYTPKDLKLYKEQKERLRKNNVKTLSIPVEFANDVRRYHIERFLNLKIDEYKAKLKNDKNLKRR